MEHEAGALLTTTDAQPLAGIALQTHPPLAWPTKRDDGSAPIPLQVQIGELELGWTSASASDGDRLLWRESLVEWLVAVVGAVVATDAMQGELAVGRSREAEVHRLEVGDDGCVLSALVREVEGPLHDGEVAVLDGEHANGKPGVGICEGHGVLGASPVPRVLDSGRRTLDGPATQQL